jgi:hypothetical protein
MGELERIWKETAVAKYKYYPSIYPKGLRNKPRRTPVKMSGVPPKNRTERLPDSSLEIYRYANRLGTAILNLSPCPKNSSYLPEPV